MGSGFDCFDRVSHTESPTITQDQQEARKLLRMLMKKYGFQDYGREWWHFVFATGSKRGELDFPIEHWPSRP
jgi:D-alanyl-D-alanine dipeptidase